MKYKKREKLKKKYKWYTYVDKILNNKLNEFVEHYEIKSKAKVIRKSVDSYLTFVNKILDNEDLNIESLNKKIDSKILEAIESFYKYKGFYDVLKQKISPLKVLVFMCEEILDDPEKLTENIKRLKRGVLELEKEVRVRFEEPSPLRFQKIFDILYIEDNPLDRETIKIYFQRKDLVIHTVETSEDALEILKYATPKLFMLDLNLKTSNLEGEEFSKLIKSKDEYQDIPIIIISAFVSELEKHKLLLETNADDLIIKPIRELADLDLILKYL
jgi:CheY-like chemotaxis protein